MCNRKTPGVSEQLSGDSRNNRVQSINRHTRGQKQPRIHLIGSYCLYKLHIMSAKKTVWKLSLLRSLQDLPFTLLPRFVQTVCSAAVQASGQSAVCMRRLHKAGLLPKATRILFSLQSGQKEPWSPVRIAKKHSRFGRTNGLSERVVHPIGT